MQMIKVKAPAKINLTLEIINKRADGFHNIESIMQAVSLYDIITIEVEDDSNISIDISGNNPLIPYDKTNLAYKAAEKFLNNANIKNKKININIEKNIPVAAGLAGGSSDAAAVLFGLNEIFKNIMNKQSIDTIASNMGSDINFCLYGGTQIASSRGEMLNSISTPDLNLIIIKPKDIFISAKEAYMKYSALKDKPVFQSSGLMNKAIEENNFKKISQLLNNGLEKAIIPDYPKIKEIKEKLIKSGCLNAVMSGSGPSVFGILSDNDRLNFDFPDCDVFYANTIKSGVFSI